MLGGGLGPTQAGSPVQAAPAGAGVAVQMGRGLGPTQAGATAQPSPAGVPEVGQMGGLSSEQMASVEDVLRSPASQNVAGERVFDAAFRKATGRGGQMTDATVEGLLQIAKAYNISPSNPKYRMLIQTRKARRSFAPGGTGIMPYQPLR